MAVARLLKDSGGALSTETSAASGTRAAGSTSRIRTTDEPSKLLDMKSAGIDL